MAAYPVMRTLILVTSAVFAASAGSPKPAVLDEISSLHECIAARFLDARAFGMSRVARIGPLGIREFHAENPAERDVLASLKQKGYNVVFFIAGRGVLDPDHLPHPDLQGPAFMLTRRDYPDASKLLTAARTALQQEHASDFQLDDNWTVSMRLLRATSNSCVACHAVSKVKLGDPLGVAIYAYRR
jgi:hypothetical protein